MIMMRYPGVPVVFRGLLIAFSLVVFNGCGLLNPFPPEKGVDLQTRIEKMMEARITGDWALVYSFLDSQYRKRISREEFLDFHHYPGLLDFTIVDIQSGSANARSAEVTVKIDFSSHGFEFNVSEKQQWVKENGGWYRKVVAQERKKE